MITPVLSFVPCTALIQQFVIADNELVFPPSKFFLYNEMESVANSQSPIAHFPPDKCESSITKYEELSFPS